MPVVTENFLEQCIENLFQNTDLSLLDEETQAAYRPQFLSALETRIGNEIMPRLNKEQLDEFVVLIDNENSGEREWNDFWTRAIPNFEQEIQRIVGDFTSEMVQSMSA